jgi:hypothetical protein
MLLGAVGQALLFAVLPSRYAVLPLLALVANTVYSTTVQVMYPDRNTYDKGVVHAATSAQLPAASYDPRKGDSPFGSTPAAEGIVVLMLGFRVNHPLGIFAPGLKELGPLADACTKEVLSRAKDYGCIGANAWHTDERANNNTGMTVYYFRSLEGLNAFAHDKVHREVWDWYNNFSKKLGFTHIGIYHETFYAPPGCYETIYANMTPIGMGATNVETLNEATGETEWIRPLVDAKNSALRSQFSRMGKAVKESESDRDLYAYHY